MYRNRRKAFVFRPQGMIQSIDAFLHLWSLAVKLSDEKRIFGTRRHAFHTAHQFCKVNVQCVCSRHVTFAIARQFYLKTLFLESALIFFELQRCTGTT